MCNEIKCAIQYSVDVINNNIYTILIVLMKQMIAPL